MSGPAPAVAAVRTSVRTSLADLTAGDVVLVACSGGADSLALAAAAAFVAPRLGLAPGAVTVDHGLQAGSGERAAAVARTCRDLGLDPVEVATVQVAQAGAGGPEAAARAARRAALEDAAQRYGACAVLLGHSLDDQAETVLLGLARGSGARSLSGMAATSGVWRRPLLGLPRATLRAACDAAGLAPWEDPHNADPAYARARVRHRVLPVLERELGPGVAAALARTADLVRADADALDGWATEVAGIAEVAGTAGSDRGTDPAGSDTGDVLAVSALEALPSAIRRRVLRSTAIAAGSPAGALTAGHVATLEGLVTAWRGQGPLDLPGGLWAERACGRLRITRGAPAARLQAPIPEVGPE